MENIIFKARVIEKREEKGENIVVLDNSLFYPDGKGGQLGDRGFIENCKVMAVKEKDGKIHHMVEALPEKEEVVCRIDGERRKDISVQHTAQHIISKVILNLFNSKTLSFHMGEETSTIDVDDLNLGNDERIKKIEEEANRIVMENRIVKTYIVNKEETQNLDIRKRVKIDKDIRIVEIDGFDITMCGGTHVNRTGDIGIIKITKFEKIKGNILRLYFIAGKRALRDYQKKSEIIKSLSRKFTTREDKVLDSIENLEREAQKLKKELKLLKEELFEYYLKENKNKKVIMKGLYLLSMEDLKFLSHEFINRGADFVYLFNKEGGIINKKPELPLDLKDLLKNLKEKFNVKGGGRDFISIKADKTLEIGDYLWKLVKLQ